jgi:NADH-quinone oxidoreductase subunit J
MMLLAAAINWHSFFFLLFALVACFFALAMLFSSNIVRMAFYLVISLGATAGLFFLAGAAFFGAMQLMIYVGGTLVLLVFGVMLTAQQSFISMKTKGGDWILAAAVGGALLVLLINVAFKVDDWKAGRPDSDQVTAAEVEDTTRIGAAFVGVRTDKLDVYEKVEREGRSKPDAGEQLSLDGMSGYLLPFEIVSIHLLVVLIGAAYLARAKKRAPARSASSAQR